MRLTTGAIFLCVISGASYTRAEDTPRPTEPVKPEATASASEDVDAYVRRLMAKRHIPGVSIAVVQGGEVVLAKGYGLANVELGVPATEETVYQLASVTKPFTATAVMMLVQDGKLALDDKITERLPDLPEAWEKVTVRHLLSHTSGIKNLTSLPIFRETMRKDFTPRELIERVAKEPLEFAPGDKWDYSNTNYILLGMIIERESGRKYGEFLAERVFKPLGMTNTRANDLHAIIPGRAQGYTWDGKALKIGEYHSPTQPFAAGMLISTVVDMSKWVAALDSGRLVDKSVLEQMWTPIQLSAGKTAKYGFGWETGDVNGHRMLSHGGGIPGFSTQLSRFTDDNLTVIVLTNADGGHAGALARGVAARFVPALAEKATEPIADEDAQTTERLRGVFERAQKGEVDSELFTDEAKRQLVPHIKGDKDRLASFGALKAFQLLERKQGDEGVVLRYRAVFEKETLKLSVSLDKAAKIRGVGIQPED